MRLVPAHANRFNASSVILESAGASLSICQELRRRDPRRYNTFSPQHDKVTRLARFSPLVEQGILSLPEIAPWLAVFEHELESFPNSKYKDQVDALSQLLHWIDIRRHRTPSRLTVVGRSRSYVIVGDDSPFGPQGE
jgi:predicted phage terminase large subunit-like protein